MDISRLIRYKIAIIACLGLALASCRTAWSSMQTGEMGNQTCRFRMIVDIPEKPDSTWAVSTAAKMLNNAANPPFIFEVKQFVEFDDGFLLSMIPQDSTKTMLGGGGVVWVNKFGEEGKGEVIWLVIYQ